MTACAGEMDGWKDEDRDDDSERGVGTVLFVWIIVSLFVGA